MKIRTGCAKTTLTEKKKIFIGQRFTRGTIGTLLEDIIAR